MERSEFYIEEHAVLYALLVKYAALVAGEQGLTAAQNATQAYAEQRGARMALRAQCDGEPLTPQNYLLYGEWEDTRGWSEGTVEALSPVYSTHTTRCGWCDSWQKHNLLQYGNMYCTYVDHSLVRGFNPENRLELGCVLSQGGAYCDFKWVGVAFENESELGAFNVLRSAKKAINTKDFLYHTAHLLAATRAVFDAELGADSEHICQLALGEFTKLFGPDKTLALLHEAQLDFSVI